MSIGSMASGFAKIIRDTTDAIVNSKIIPNIAAGTYKTASKIGKAVFNVGLKGTAGASSAAASTVSGIRNHKQTINKIGKGIFDGTLRGVGEATKFAAHEGVTLAQAGVNAVKMLPKLGIVKSVPLDKSLIGWKFTGRGKALMIGGALIAGSLGAGKDYLTEGRMGRNDGQLYKLTPQMTNPYEISSQMAGTQIGQSFANNAGATGDLVFALDRLNK